MLNLNSVVNNTQMTAFHNIYCLQIGNIQLTPIERGFPYLLKTTKCKMELPTIGQNRAAPAGA